MDEKKLEPIGEILGEIECPDCGGPAYVKRTKRRGNHYMSTCPNCGIDQRTGPSQKRMAKYVPVGTLQAKGQENEKPTNEGVIEPSVAVKNDGQNEPSKTAAKPRKYGLLVGVGVVALAAFGLAS